MDKSREVTARTAQVRATRLNRRGSKAAKLSPHTALHILYWLSCLIHYIALHITKLLWVQSILPALHSPAYALPVLYCNTLYCIVLHCTHGTGCTVQFCLHCSALYYCTFTLYCTTLYCMHHTVANTVSQ